MPRKLIKDGAIIEDTFLLLESSSEFTSQQDLLIPLALWNETKPLLKDHKGKIGIQVLGETEPSEFADDLSAVDLIAIDFPAFKDGRGYSLARMLRQKFNYGGELRATGDVLRDQLFYLYRCGFNSFAVREDRCIEDALNGLKDFSVLYQADVHQPKPIYQRRS